MRAWVILVCLLLIPAARHVAAEMRSAEIEGCHVFYHHGDEDLARQVARSVATMAGDIGARLGVSFLPGLRLALVGGETEFHQRVGGRTPEWMLAVALPERNEVVVRADQVGATIENALVPTLRHEECHLALFVVERRAGRPLPLWFHEGVACYLSGQSLFRDWQVFDLAAAQGALIPLRDLEERMPRRREQAALAYLQSESFINFLARERSGHAIRWILDAFASSRDFEAAVEQATGEGLASLEWRWAERYRSRFPWLTVLWQATTLFGVLALVTVAIYLVRRRRARRTRERWEVEDWRLGALLRQAEGDWGDEADGEAEDEEDRP